MVQLSAMRRSRGSLAQRAGLHPALNEMLVVLARLALHRANEHAPVKGTHNLGVHWRESLLQTEVHTGTAEPEDAFTDWERCAHCVPPFCSRACAIATATACHHFSVPHK